MYSSAPLQTLQPFVGDSSSFVDTSSESQASLGPAVPKKGAPGSTLNAPGFPPKYLPEMVVLVRVQVNATVELKEMD